MKTTTHRHPSTHRSPAYGTGKKHALLFLLFSLAFTLTSCTTLLDLWTDYEVCSVPGCHHKKKRGSGVCAHHDYGTAKQSLDSSLEKVRKQYGGKP